MPLLLALLLAAPPAFALRIHAPVTVETIPLNPRSNCGGAFIAHELDHWTTPTTQPVGFYDSNGAGLAINDLDADGLLDIVLANLGGDNAVLWNRGALEFEREALPSATPARGAAIIDVDADGLLDIVFTQQASAPLFWRNQGGVHFQREVLKGVTYIGYAMDWLDADRDGDLDLLTGSYDVESEKILGQSAPKSGVIYYENLGDRFRATRIAERSNTLAIWTGLNLQGEHTIIIGNDFAVEDKYFSFRDGAPRATAPLEVMPHSTMSYDGADLDNDGAPEIFAVDMKPYSHDDAMMAQWQPVMEMMMALPEVEGDPQIMENVLYKYGDAGQAYNIAPAAKLDGTGWSWSAQFGDLDNDGFQDLYVVNGMISRELFSHLPNNELVEENQAYRNLDGDRFAPMPSWSLDDTSSGRGMTMADLDNDGDLDIVVNNLLSAAKLFENRLCGGDSIMVDLHQPGVGNGSGIGARLTLYTDAGAYHRDVTAVSGYLSGDSSRVHFGFPQGAPPQRLTISWNDGEYSEVDDIKPNTWLRVTRA
jgi:hypothetical protein